MDTERRQITEGYMDVPGAADYLNISEGTVRAYILNDKIPFHKIGRLVRFRREELDAWVAAQRPSNTQAAS